MKFLLLTLIILRPSAAYSKDLQLVLNWKPEPEFGGFYEAQFKGFFEKEGLKVKILEGGAGTPTTQMVAMGQAEFGISGGEEIPLAVDRGADLVALFAVYQINPLGIMVRESRKEITSLQKLWQSPGTLSVQVGLPFVAYFKKKWGEPTVKLVPYQGGISPFLADAQFAQQCFVTSEPIDAAEKGAPARSFIIADEGMTPYSTLVIVRKKWMTENQEQTRKFIRAIRKGWESYLKDPTATNIKMAAMNPAMSVKTFDRIAKEQKRFITTPETDKKGLGSMNEKRWSDLSKQLFDLKLIRTVRPGADYLRSVL